MDLGRIPVVDRANPRHVVGVLRRSNIVQAISMSLVDSQKRKHHMERLRMEPVLQTQLTELDIRYDDAACDKQLSEMGLPKDCVIVSIRRGKTTIVPRSFTRLQAGDRVIALVGKSSVETLRTALSKGNEEEQGKE